MVSISLDSPGPRRDSMGGPEPKYPTLVELVFALDEFGNKKQIIREHHDGMLRVMGMNALFGSGADTVCVSTPEGGLTYSLLETRAYFEQPCPDKPDVPVLEVRYKLK